MICLKIVRKVQAWKFHVKERSKNAAARLRFHTALCPASGQFLINARLRSVGYAILACTCLDAGEIGEAHCILQVISPKTRPECRRIARHHKPGDMISSTSDVDLSELTDFVPDALPLDVAVSAELQTGRLIESLFLSSQRYERVKWT